MSRFHKGERSIHERFGYSTKVEPFGDLHIVARVGPGMREFFEERPFLIVGSANAYLEPTCHFVYGDTGWCTVSEDHSEVVLSGPTAGNAVLRANIAAQPHVGILAIEPATRQRIRINGLALLTDSEIRISVRQCYGNCPKYIHARVPHSTPRIADAAQNFTALTTELRAMIAAADTFYVASGFLDPEDSNEGFDASHRGGKPGFITTPDEHSLVYDDYQGNFFYNTFGNYLKNPHCGLLIIDYDAGHTLQIGATALVTWDDWKAPKKRGVMATVTFTVTSAVLTPHALPFTWELLERSPLCP